MKPIPAATLLARLEEAGYRRHDALRLTRLYVSEVIFHDRDDQGRLIPTSRAAVRSISPEEEMRQRLRRLGCPEHLIEAKVREWRTAASTTRSRG